MRKTTEVELILEKHSSLNDLEMLVALGCERVSLLTLLELTLMSDSSWEHLLGNDLESLKKSVRDIRNCAGRIEQLDRTDLIHHVTIEIEVPRIDALREGANLARSLRMYADELDRLPSAFGPRWKHRLNACKAHICALVVLRTGNFHDREVAAIISAMLDEQELLRPRRGKSKARVRRKNPHPGYTEKAHQRWRLQNKNGIDDFRERLNNKISPPPSPLR